MELIEIHGTPLDEEFADSLGQYRELRDEIFAIKTWLYGLAFMIFLTYLNYHVISKLRGNEKNVKLNNYGIGLSLLGLVCYSVSFINTGTYTVAQDKHMSW